MPASMMRAEAGGSPKVKGKSIATVVSGEIPGNTPTSVPIMTPAKQNRRFCQLAAVCNPSARLSNSSTDSSHLPRSVAFSWTDRFRSDHGLRLKKLLLCRA